MDQVSPPTPNQAIRVLTQRPSTPVDWIEYAQANGIPLECGAAARVARCEEVWPTNGPFKVGDDPDHGIYWKYVGGHCKCDDCREAWRRVRAARYSAAARKAQS